MEDMLLTKNETRLKSVGLLLAFTEQLIPLL